LLRELEPGEGFRAYEAQHVRVDNRRARVKHYQVTGYTTREELEGAAQRFQRDIEALSQIDRHPNIVRAYDFLADVDSDDTYWLLLEWIEGRTLRDRLDDAAPIAFEEQLSILRSLAEALATCHDQGILHRNLTPASVYLADDGTVKLGDFDFARVSSSGHTISKTGVPLTMNKYTPQELRGGFRPADARSDLYALGAIWYDMVLRRPSDEPVLMQLVEGANLPADAKELLRSLLAPQPNKRPASAKEVREWLELLA
jgi:serine/threonine protein kinase